MKMKITITTMSNMFIGGAPAPFEIGGIDQQTAVDNEGRPYIPGSTIKGALRNIARETEETDETGKIKELFRQYIITEKAKFNEKVKTLNYEESDSDRIKGQYDKALEAVTPEYIFGINWLNNTPKLLFGDFILDKRKKPKSCFSIDMKNTIDSENLTSNPRTYKVAKAGLKFYGEIEFYKIDKLNSGKIQNAEELCCEYVNKLFKKFNDGFYRIGNSKSRGYGRVECSVTSEVVASGGGQ